MLKDNLSQSAGNTSNNQNENNESEQPEIERAPVSINKVEGSTTANTTMTDVISSVRDTVVEIVTENIQESAFYGQYVTSGAGSGVIINENGYIITNNHVVAGANTIYVRTTDQKEYKASLVGTDEESDIAVIKIDATSLKAATLGDSSAIKLGEAVIAIGNPLGSLGGTVTDGIISALDREVTIDGQEMRLLQTNAAVNPGNSGGGLFNMAGELIGVVNAKSSSSNSGATIEGLGFAIPINHA
ncbi:MAG: trypsin-like peptidase domain-containing protein, partial [Clostridia bacterium]|nr:trypsin-like peptidase domain-containing protein [Clostridia bacterium]